MNQAKKKDFIQKAERKARTEVTYPGKRLVSKIMERGADGQHKTGARQRLAHTLRRLAQRRVLNSK